MMIFIKNLRNDLITTNPDLNFVSQLKMFATSQLAEQRAQRWNGEMSPELFTESEMRLISPPRYSSMSPMYEDNDFDPSQAQAADEERSNFLTQINHTQATWALTKLLPIGDPGSLPPTLHPYFDPDNFAQPPSWYTAPESSPMSPAVDENDGPTFFNKSPSILGGKPTKKRNSKRRLFE